MSVEEEDCGNIELSFPIHTPQGQAHTYTPLPLPPDWSILTRAVHAVQDVAVLTATEAVLTIDTRIIILALV